ERSSEGGRSRLAVDAKNDPAKRLRLERARLLDHDPRALVQWKAADSGAEGWQRERRGAELVRDLERAPGRPPDRVRARDPILAHHRGMDHPAGGQPSRAGRDRIANRDRSLRHRLALDLVPTRALNRARDPGAHPE